MHGGLHALRAESERWGAFIIPGPRTRRPLSSWRAALDDNSEFFTLAVFRFSSTRTLPKLCWYLLAPSRHDFCPVRLFIASSARLVVDGSSLDARGLEGLRVNNMTRAAVRRAFSLTVRNQPI